MAHPDFIPRQKGQNNLDDQFATGVAQSFGYADKSVNYPEWPSNAKVTERHQYLIPLVMESYNDSSPTSETSATLQYTDANLHYLQYTESYLGIAMVEMVHRQRSGEAVINLGGRDLLKKQVYNNSQVLIGDNEKEFVGIAIAGESQTIRDYQNVISKIKQMAKSQNREIDEIEAYVIQLTEKKIADETFHIRLLTEIQNKLV